MKKWSMVLAGALSLMLSSTALAAVTENWEEGEVSASGYCSYADAQKAAGIKDGSAMQSYLVTSRSEDMAVDDAKAQLMNYIRGLRVSGDTTVGTWLDKDADMQGRIDTLMKRGVTVLDSKAGQDGYQVDFKIDLYGYSQSVCRLVLPPVYERAALPQPTQEIALDKTYTGLIVDCSGLGVQRALEPVIQDTTGRRIYFYEALSWDTVVVHGMAAYGKAGSANARAGADPLTVTAVGSTGNGTVLTVSVEDADRILAANAANDFFTPCAVVFNE